MIGANNVVILSFVCDVTVNHNRIIVFYGHHLNVMYTATNSSKGHNISPVDYMLYT